MQNDNHKLLLGAAGWRHEGWCDSYYPGDLPEEWQLAYYANEFPLVLVRHGEQGAIEALTELYDDQETVFRFVYEAELTGEEADFALLEHISRSLAPIESGCAGIILCLSGESRVSEIYLRQIASLLNSRFPCCIDAPQACLTDLLPALRDLSLGVCWHADSSGLPPEGFTHAALAVARVSAKQLNLKDLRKMIESCLAVSTQDRQVAMLFDAVSGQPELIRNAQVIAELL